MSYKKVLTEGSTRTPEQQRASDVAARKHPGRNKAPAPDKMGAPSDTPREKREQDLEKSTADRH